MIGPERLRKLVFISVHLITGPLWRRGAIGWMLFWRPIPTALLSLAWGKFAVAASPICVTATFLDEHWQGRDRFENTGDHRTPVPLPEEVQCYAIAATTAKASTKLGDDLIGDGLVTVKSALGQHKEDSLDLDFPESHQWLGRGMNHMDLLSHPEVYATLKSWLEG